MFNANRPKQFDLYNAARQRLIADPSILIDLEKFFADHLFSLVKNNIEEMAQDYNEASCLYPFWQNYPPDDRGRKPKGDQYPWIEVGEHSIGAKLPHLLRRDFAVRDAGVPTGADQRFILTSTSIESLTNGLTDSVFLCVDIKSVGPRDKKDEAVMSHNQVSGDGIWASQDEGVKNGVLQARGKRAVRPFHCSIPPIYVLSDETVAPVLTIPLKPIYTMVKRGETVRCTGQPLESIDVAAIPNGLLLTLNPNYLQQYPKLFFPGKDDRKKKAEKRRARVSFKFLRSIAPWRHQSVKAPAPVVLAAPRPLFT